MRANAISAVIFSNSNDENLKELTENRSMASLPFGGRYRLIDFTLSNLVNAGVSNIGIITKENYRSLMDHVGNGLFWDLDRKNGGLHIIPPFITGESKYSGLAETSVRALEFVSTLNSDYVLACESGTIANIDVAALINSHIENEADITIAYRHGENPDKFKNTLRLQLDKNNTVINISKANQLKEAGNFSIGLAIFTKTAFVSLVNAAKTRCKDDIFATLLSENFASNKIFAFEHKGFVAVMDSRKSFFENNMMLLNTEVRNDLFNADRPILTKTRDDMPTRYGTHSSVTESLIADGCIIEGTVKNSILFRGVRVHSGAVVENSILTQGVEIGENANVKYAVFDKNAVISGKEPIKGTNRKAFIVKKNQVI